MFFTLFALQCLLLVAAQCCYCSAAAAAAWISPSPAGATTGNTGSTRTASSSTSSSCSIRTSSVLAPRSRRRVLPILAASSGSGSSSNSSGSGNQEDPIKNNNNNDKNEEEGMEDFQRRMAVVRSLQMSYYKNSAVVKKQMPSSSSSTSSSSPEDNDHHPQQDDDDVNTYCSLNENTGELLDLPLFRAPWWEVPGRSNVLNIHEPIYTNMFEKILYGPKPWTFGHLYLEHGSRNLKSEDPRFQLETWETTKHTESSAVLGCLMNISDYRRLVDGRLLLLVHAMERFVVTDVQQALPYSIVTAQLLPDAEELDPAGPELIGRGYTEQDLAVPRAMAVQESVRFHEYEYDRDHVLPMKDRPDMSVSDITGSDIAKVLPYCPFSKTLEPPIPSYDPLPVPLLGGATTSQAKEEKSPPPSQNNEEEQQEPPPPLPSLEYRLLCRGVYQTPLTDPEFPQRQHLSADELEYELWLAINNFLIQTRTPVSPVLLGLLPIHLDIWPDVVATTPTSISTTTSTTTTTASPPPPRRSTATSSIFTNTKYNMTASSEDKEKTTGTTTTSSTTSTSTSTTTPVVIPTKPFALKQIVSELASLDNNDDSSSSSITKNLEHDFVQVSPDYPAHRRQRRLSYSAAHLLESNSQVANQELRPKLLATPTTQQRLRMVLEKFDQWQEAKWGEFQ